MTNYIAPYNPIFYANEALELLEGCLGMSNRVHRGFDAERRSFGKGDTIRIRKPQSLAVTTGGTDNVEDLDDTSYLDVVVDTWKQVKFGLTDKELAFTTDQIIEEHISPAIYALAHNIESSLTGLYKYSPYHYDLTGTYTTDIVAARKILRDNAGPLIDSDRIYCAVDSTLEANLLQSTMFYAANIAGDGANRDALVNGSLGVRFGTEFFVQQTMTQHTGGTVLAGSDQASALNASVAVRDTSIVLKANTLTDSETIKAGDVFYLGTDTANKYVVTADVTITGAATNTLSIYPAIQVAQDADTVVTFEDAGSANYSDAYYPSIMFHKNAYALAMAPLPEIGDEAGARMAVATDPRTGLSLRARVAYTDTTAKVVVTYDVLYGVKCINPKLAVIMRRNA